MRRSKKLKRSKTKNNKVRAGAGAGLGLGRRLQIHYGDGRTVKQPKKTKHMRKAATHRVQTFKECMIAVSCLVKSIHQLVPIKNAFDQNPVMNAQGDPKLDKYGNQVTKRKEVRNLLTILKNTGVELTKCTYHVGSASVSGAKTLYHSAKMAQKATEFLQKKFDNQNQKAMAKHTEAEAEKLADAAKAHAQRLGENIDEAQQPVIDPKKHLKALAQQKVKHAEIKSMHRINKKLHTKYGVRMNQGELREAKRLFQNRTPEWKVWRTIEGQVQLRKMPKPPS